MKLNIKCSIKKKHQLTYFNSHYTTLLLLLTRIIRIHVIRIRCFIRFVAEFHLRKRRIQLLKAVKAMQCCYSCLNLFFRILIKENSIKSPICTCWRFSSYSLSSIVLSPFLIFSNGSCFSFIVWSIFFCLLISHYDISGNHIILIADLDNSIIFHITAPLFWYNLRVH